MTRFLNSLDVSTQAQTDAQGKLIGTFSTMPTASANNVGCTVMYIGSDGTYTNGKFYTCVQSGSTYSWREQGVVAEDIEAGSVTATEPNRVIISDASGNLDTSDVTSTELSFLDGATSNIQAQIDALESSVGSSGPLAGTGISIGSDGRTVNHSNSITARTSYLGSTTTVPRIQYDAQGHITAATTSTVYPPTTAGTANQYWRSQGSGVGAWTSPSTSPTSGSSTLITSGGVYTAIQNIQSQVDSIEGQVEAVDSFNVQVVSSLPSTGVEKTIYFVPADSTGTNNVKDEYMWINSAWEKIGSSEFDLNITQNTSGITINNTSLQTATTSRPGLMTVSQVSALNTATSNISTIQNNITTINQSITNLEETVENIESSGSGVSVAAGTGISVSQSGTTYTVGHSNSTTAHTSYVGSTTAVPRIQCDAQGHITAITTATIYPPTTAGTANQYWRSDGSGAGAWTTPATTPTSGSSTLITSGAVYDAIQDIQTSAGATTVSAGTGITVSASGSAYTVGHSNSVTAGSVGSATAMPIITYDAQGHITGTSTTTVYPPTTAGTANQYWRSDGSGAGAWTTPATSPTSGSSTLISSGAVYTALQDKADADDVITGGTLSLSGSSLGLTLNRSAGNITIPSVTLPTGGAQSVDMSLSGSTLRITVDGHSDSVDLSAVGNTLKGTLSITLDSSLRNNEYVLDIFEPVGEQIKTSSGDHDEVDTAYSLYPSSTLQDIKLNTANTIIAFERYSEFDQYETKSVAGGPLRRFEWTFPSEYITTADTISKFSFDGEGTGSIILNCRWCPIIPYFSNVNYISGGTGFKTKPSSESAYFTDFKMTIRVVNGKTFGIKCSMSTISRSRNLYHYGSNTGTTSLYFSIESIDSIEYS